jgi:hypothetical protein
LDTRGFFPKNSFNHSVRGSRSLPKIKNVRSSLLQHRTNCLGPPRVLLWANRDIFAWQHATCFCPPKVLFRANQDVFAWQLVTFFGSPKEFLQANRDICARQHMACLGPPKELIKIKCRTVSSPPLGQLRHFCMALKTCLGPFKELIAPHEGSRHQPLRANRDVFASQHVNSHGLPKHTTEATNKIHLSLAN